MECESPDVFDEMRKQKIDRKSWVASIKDTTTKRLEEQFRAQVIDFFRHLVTCLNQLFS